MHMKAAGHLSDPFHWECKKGECEFICVKNVQRSLTAYLNELDRVFFLKENKTDRESWWLSAFYSFCIQGRVRRALMDLASTHQTGDNLYGVQQYLHLAIRLFIAIPTKCDPLIDDPSLVTLLPATSDSPAGRKEQYKKAQLAVKQAHWASEGIGGFADYLKQLFEDDEGVLKEPEKDPDTDNNVLEDQTAQSATCGLNDAGNSPSHNTTAAKSREILPPTPRITALPSPKATSISDPDEQDSCSDFDLELDETRLPIRCEGSSRYQYDDDL
jgi:hypothetical protein